MDGFDPTLLKSFLVVAQEASFTRAAERLHLTQSAVSAHVRRLEENLERQLFSRSTRSVALTEEGETLLGYARAILQLNEKAKLQLSGKPRSVHVRIGSSDDFMSSWLPRVLHDFQTAYPAVSLEVHVANMATLLAKLNCGDLDLIVGSRCNGRQAGTLLRREPLVWLIRRRRFPTIRRRCRSGYFRNPALTGTRRWLHSPTRAATGASWSRAAASGVFARRRQRGLPLSRSIKAH